LRFKLDENLGPSAQAPFLESGHDALLVLDQGLSGKRDDELIEACRAEGRCLVTLDLDFSNVLRFPPSAYSGIAVLRLPEPATRAALVDAIRTLVRGLVERSIEGKLWVVRHGEIREHGKVGETY
jgi:predicted nuclease of predicted toxin-antitoxin system